VALPGYPMDNIVPLAAEAAAANTIGFSPTDTLPFTNVQDAIEGAAALSTDQLLISNRSNVPFTTGGTGNTYTLTPTPAITSYTAGQTFLIRPDRENTGAATLNVNGLGARNLYKTDATGTPVAIVAGELAPGREIQVYDDGTQLLVTLGRDNVRNGSTSNGIWVQLPDGTQICRVTLSWSATITTGAHGGFRSTSEIWTFPTAFISAPKVVATVESVSAFGAGVGTISATSVPVYVTAIATQASEATRVVNAIAIGRWYA
jgi:hypothetical protein